MIRIKEGGWHAGPIDWPRKARIAAAWALRAASLALDSLARRIAVVPDAGPCGDRRIEFHFEAGAPEGALYIDGKLVGWLEGVQRL